MNIISISPRDCKLISPLVPSEARSSKDSSVLLDAIEIVARQSLEALQAFQDKKLSVFDPDIGDEACQIRALLILQMDAQSNPNEIACASCELQKLLIIIDTIRKEWAKLDEELICLSASLKEQLSAIRNEKVRLSRENELALQNVPKGTLESKSIWQEFQIKMKQLCLQENPIKQKIQLQEEEISAKKIKTFENRELDTTLSSNILRLIFCYLIGKASQKILETNPINGRVSYKKAPRVNALKIQGLNVNGPLFEKILQRAKIWINQESMDALVEESKKIQGKRAKWIQRCMQATLPSAKQELKEYSFYHACELVIKRIKAMGLPILVLARRPEDNPDYFSMRQLFKPVMTNGKFKFSPVAMSDDTSPVLVIEGISSKAQNMGLANVIDQCGGLMKMVRLNLAQHRFCTAQQEADPSILKMISADLSEEIDRLRIQRSKAQEEGCSRENPSNFMIDHIYADVMRAQVISNLGEI